MTNFIFELLNYIGIHYPIHPVLTHIPMGMVMGGFIFALLAYFSKKQLLYKSAFHCAMIALIAVPPTVILGLLDWQHGFDGEWLSPVKYKFVLTIAFTVLLAILVKIGKNAEKLQFTFLILYGLTLASGLGLGYWGGKLIFG